MYVKQVKLKNATRHQLNIFSSSSSSSSSNGSSNSGKEQFEI